MATEAHDAMAGAEGAAHAAGMPQLDPSYFPNLIFWLVVALVAIYLILTRVALPRIASVLAERKGAITNDLAAAEELKLRALEAEKAYEKALVDARVEAAKIVAQTKAEIQADLAKATAEADAQIAGKAADSEKRIAEIRANMEESVAEVARDVAKEIVTSLGGKVGPRVLNASLDARLKE